MAMTLLITEIQWDTEGHPLEECQLPTTVLVVECFDPTTPEFVQEIIGETLQEAFGFIHHGFKYERLADVQPTHTGGGIFPPRLAVMQCPTTIHHNGKTLIAKPDTR